LARRSCQTLGDIRLGVPKERKMSAPVWLASAKTTAFDEVLDAAMPWEDGMVVMLRAYFDASRRTSGVSCVAGVAFGIDRAKKAERQWRSIFGDAGCHMTELHARKGHFAGISDGEADALCRAAIRTINEHASLISVVSCDVDEVDRLSPKSATADSELLLDSARSAYNCGLHWTMGAMGSLLNHQDQRVQYWFERGDNFQGAARRLMAALNDPKVESLRRFYCYGSYAFVANADAMLFDAADVVAWEWGKHIERLRQGKAARPSLAALMNDDPCVVNGQPFCRTATRYANHYTGPALERFFSKMTQVMRATSADEVRAAVLGLS
jgi:hypothetical protein